MITNDKKAKLKAMLSYSAAEILGGGGFYIIGIYFTIFLTQVESISIIYAGLIVMIGKIWDAINDPIMGIISDRTVTKYGRRRPYILASALPVLIAYSMLWYSFGIQGEIPKVIYFTFAYLLFCTAFTLFAVPYSSLLPDITEKYGERTQYIGMKYIFSGLGCVLPFFISNLIIGSSYSPTDKSKFLIMGVVLGLFYSIPLIFTFIGTKERTVLLSAPPKISLKEVFSEYYKVLKNKSYKKYITISLCTTGACALISGAFFYYLAYIAGEYKIYSTLILIFGAAEIAGFPLIYLISRKISKHVPSKITAPFIIIGLIIAFLIVPYVMKTWLLYAIVILIGFGVSGLKIVPKNLFPDLTDIDELIYGKRREGVCSSVSTFGDTFIAGFSIFLISVILQLFGFVETPSTWDNATMGGPYPQMESVKTGIYICYCIIPSLLVAIALFVSRTYKLDQKGHELIKALITAKKENNYIDIVNKDKLYLEQLTGIKYELLWIAKDNI